MTKTDSLEAAASFRSKETTMFLLIDTFNNIVISRHRTLSAALTKDVSFAKAVKRANGRNSYIPTTIKRDNPNRSKTTSAFEAAIALNENEIEELQTLEAEAW